MPDYNQSKIYKLVSNKSPDIYIGSCLMRLSSRLSSHRSKSNKTSSRKLFIDDAIITIVLIEDYPCNNKNELKARELLHITNTPCININKPFPCEIVYGDGKAWRKEYNIINAVAIKKTVDEYGKKHRLLTVDKIKEYRKINAVAIKEQKREKIICDCGCEIRKSEKSRHKRSKKHMDLINKLTT